MRLSSFLSTFLYVLCFSLCFSSLVLASESASDFNANVDKKLPTSKYAIGLNAGDVVGNGLIVRFYSHHDFFQMTYGGYVIEKNDEKYFNVSFSYSRYLSKLNASSFSSQVGLKWVSGAAVVYDSFQGENFNMINLGSGVGLDFGSVGKTGLIYSLNAIYTLSFDGLRSPEFASLSFKPTFGVLYNFD